MRLRENRPDIAAAIVVGLVVYFGGITVIFLGICFLVALLSLKIVDGSHPLSIIASERMGRTTVADVGTRKENDS